MESAEARTLAQRMEAALNATSDERSAQAEADLARAVAEIAEERRLR